MSELTIELDRLIQQAALDGALTQDAVAQFHAVFTKCDAQTDRIDELEKANANVKEERHKLSIDLGIAQGLVNLAAEAQVALIERESKCLKLELSAKYQEMRVEDHKEMFTTVFRNSVLRKEVLGQNENYTEVSGASHSSYPTKETVEEEEK